MALGDSYVSRAELRAYLKIDASKTSMDTALDAAIAAASRYVDDHCRRQFNKSDTATPRVFSVSGRTVFVDDFYTTDGLLINGAAWDSDVYELQPLNGVYNGQPGWPFYRLRTCYHVGHCSHRVTVTAKWGWNAVPSAIKQGTLLQAAHLYKMADAPNGVAGMDQFGAIRIRSLPQVEDLICPYVVRKVLVG